MGDISVQKRTIVGVHLAGTSVTKTASLCVLLRATVCIVMSANQQEAAHPSRVTVDARGKWMRVLKTKNTKPQLPNTQLHSSTGSIYMAGCYSQTFGHSCQCQTLVSVMPAVNVLDCGQYGTYCTFRLNGWSIGAQH